MISSFYLPKYYFLYCKLVNSQSFVKYQRGRVGKLRCFRSNAPSLIFYKSMSRTLEQYDFTGQSRSTAAICMRARLLINNNEIGVKLIKELLLENILAIPAPPFPSEAKQPLPVTIMVFIWTWAYSAQPRYEACCVCTTL